MEESLFPPDSGNGYGWFGYQSQMVHVAVAEDRADMMAEALTRGWIDRATKTLANDTLRSYCRRKNAARCDAYLADEGFPQ